MACVTATNPKGGFTAKAYPGDNKTLLAFNFDNKQRTVNLAGFSIQVQPPGKPAYFLLNDLLFPTPNKHAVNQSEPPNSSANSPFQKYRWTHFTGQYHQGLNPAVGLYKYTVTPRYFDNNGNMLALDATLSASVTIDVGPFKKGPLSLGFTRGYMQSQAFEHHFGMHAQLQPSGKALQFDTSAAAGTDSTGKSYAYADEYAWMGESARVLVFDVLNEVLNDPTLSLKVFAYDLNEPDVVTHSSEARRRGPRSRHPRQRLAPYEQSRHHPGRSVHHAVQQAEEGQGRHCAWPLRALLARQDLHRLQERSGNPRVDRFDEFLDHRPVRECQSRSGF